jgi:predicted RecB family endonuclease
VSGDAVLQRSLTLRGEAASSGAARRFVRALLSAADRLEWAEAAELAVSEVVTNAVLHAHSEVEVSAVVEPTASACASATTAPRCRRSATTTTTRRRAAGWTWSRR